LKALKDLNFPLENVVRPADPISKITKDGFQGRPASIGTIILDSFAKAWRERKNKR
jgi:hypothetical protein